MAGVGIERIVTAALDAKFPSAATLAIGIAIAGRFASPVVLIVTMATLCLAQLAVSLPRAPRLGG